MYVASNLRKNVVRDSLTKGTVTAVFQLQTFVLAVVEDGHVAFIKWFVMKQ